MQVIVLGSAAGGGFPQWNCRCVGCNRARAGDPRARPRSQTSLAVSVDGMQWFIVNASPDLRQQLLATHLLAPQGGDRSSPIAGVVLTGGEVDTVAGLLSLRERQILTVFATAPILGIVAGNSIFQVLAADIVVRQQVDLDVEFSLTLADGTASGMTCSLFAVPGKVPLFEESPHHAPSTTDATTTGAHLRHGGSSLFFIPGCAGMTPDLSDRLRGANCVLFDGTLWRDDEMMISGTGEKTGQRMGHMSVSGPHGAIAAFADLHVRQKIFIHINNTNPLLLEDSAEHAAAVAAGWSVAHDGMAFSL